MAAEWKDKVPHFVLDGAACGGKTEGAGILRKRLWNEKRVLLIVVPEVARMVFDSGVRQEEIMPYPGPKYAFEKNTLSFQVRFEEYFMVCAEIQRARTRALRNGELVALCGDRAAMSIASFTGMSTFRSIANELGLDVLRIRDKHDAVFIPVTAADGAEEHYKNRYETAEQAREHHSRIIEAWAGHKYVRVFPNVEVVGGVIRKISFEEKMEWLYKEVREFLGV